MDLPGGHVLAAFGLAGSSVSVMESGRHVFRCGNAVLKRAEDPVAAAWIAGIFEHLEVPGVRIARPIRSLDGRWVVAGYFANRHVAGRVDSRYDEIISVADRLGAAFAGIPEPRFLRARTDLWAWAERAAWGEAEAELDRLGHGHGARLFAELAAQRRPVQLLPQIIHGDLFGNVLFAGSAEPAVVDMTPYYRPADWAVAIVVVDAVTWGGADIELVDEHAQRPGWVELVRRATLFRLAASLLHPRATPESLVEMLAGADLINAHLRALSG